MAHKQPPCSPAGWWTVIQLTPDDIELLRPIRSLPAQLLHKLEAAQGRSVALEDAEYEVLLDAVAERLATEGFDAAYRPTALGTALERLIDRITASAN